MQGLATIVKHQTNVDESIKEQLENEEMKYKKHKGIMNVPIVSLPPVLDKSLKNYLEGVYVVRIVIMM